MIIPFLQQHSGFLLQHDDARPHIGRPTTNLLGRNNTHVFNWPVKSPDLSQIEHPYELLGRQVRENHLHIFKVHDHELALNWEWNAFTVPEINKMNL